MLDSSPTSTIAHPDPAAHLENIKSLVGAVGLDDIQPAGVEWLWPGRISLGNVTLLVSDPGVGKSLVALDIAARVSTARPWPDVGTRSEERGTSCISALDPRASLLAPSSVLLLNIEDHFHNTIRPRLDALGADCSRILAWTYVRGEQVLEAPHLFAINRDLGRLFRALGPACGTDREAPPEERGRSQEIEISAWTGFGIQFQDAEVRGRRCKEGEQLSAARVSEGI